MTNKKKQGPQRDFGSAGEKNETKTKFQENIFGKVRFQKK